MDLFSGMYQAIRWHYREENWQNYTFPQGLVDDFNKYYLFPIEQSYPIVYIAVLFTLARYFFEIAICKVN